MEVCNLLLLSIVDNLVLGLIFLSINRGPESAFFFSLCHQMLDWHGIMSV